LFLNNILSKVINLYTLAKKFTTVNTIYLLLGSNAGNREHIMTDAAVLVSVKIGQITDQSAFYETAAWGKTDQPDFLNKALAVVTELDAVEVLRAALEIEHMLGRERGEKWGQRNLDIDLLLFNDEVIDLAELKVPHPHMQDRRFTLTPLAEIAADVQHPVLGRSIQELLDACTDPLAVAQLVYE
jgi:2-amino-4-hydroxy-6-hydroxymethyldihydropteridine diphosphokinase